MKLINRGWAKPGDEIAQPVGIVLGGNLTPPKPEKPPSKTLSDEQRRLVAEIKRHHPMATTEQILKDLEAWGVEQVAIAAAQARVQAGRQVGGRVIAQCG